MGDENSRKCDWNFKGIPAIFLLILLSPFILIRAFLYALSGFVLNIAIWLGWCLRGRDVLLVYSDSPIWREYVEEEILPQVESRAIILNWSKRKQWKNLLAIHAFWRFGGLSEFNPLAVVFRPFHQAKVFRFFKPFQEFKRGQTTQVEQIKTELFETLNATSQKK
jgi:hypothetical protein